MSEGGVEKRLVLVVDDDPVVRQMLQEMLGRDYEVVVAGDGPSGLATLETHRFAAILADQMMPGMTGVEMLRQAAERQPGAARVLVTASQQVEDLKDAVNIARIDRFLAKPVRLMDVRESVRGAVRERELERQNAKLNDALKDKARVLQDALETVRQHEQVLEARLDEQTRELKRALSELEQLAVRDPLTGLINHRYFQEVLTAEISRARRHGRQVSLLLIDLDDFGNYNACAGHTAGDQLLADVARLVVGTLHEAEASGEGEPVGTPDSRREVSDPAGRVEDVAARYGPAEMAVILPETPKDGAVVRADRIRADIERHPFAKREVQPGGKVTVSIGVATLPEDADARAGLIQAALGARDRAKREGKNRVVTA